MSSLAARPAAGLVLLLVVGLGISASLVERSAQHGIVARALLFFASLASLVSLAIGWRPGMHPFHYPVVAGVLVAASAALCALGCPRSERSLRLLGSAMVVCSSVAFALWPTVAWAWKQALNSWFLWSGILYAVSGGALLAAAAHIDLSAGADAPMSVVAVALVTQTFALLLLGLGAQVAWGSTWAWDPVQSWFLAAWLATAALAIVLSRLGWRHRRARLASNLATAFVLAVLWGAFPLVHWLGLLSVYLPN